MKNLLAAVIALSVSGVAFAERNPADLSTMTEISRVPLRKLLNCRTNCWVDLTAPAGYSEFALVVNKGDSVKFLSRINMVCMTPTGEEEINLAEKDENGVRRFPELDVFVDDTETPYTTASFPNHCEKNGLKLARIALKAAHPELPEQVSSISLYGR